MEMQLKKHDYKYLLEVEQSINYFTTRMLDVSTVDDVLWGVAKDCISRLAFEDCVIYLVDKNKKALIQKAAFGPKSPEHYQILNPMEIPIGKGIVGTVAATGMPEIIHDTRKDNRYIQDDEMRLSEIAVPIKINNETIGVIDCEHSKGGFFDEKHLYILTTIASLSAIRINRVLSEADAQENRLQLEAAKTRIAEIKMLSLQSQMNPHFIFNCLSVLQYLINEGNTTKANEVVIKLSRLMRNVMNVAHKETVTLHEDLAITAEYINLEQLRQNNFFTYSIMVEPTIDSDYTQIPPMLLHPIINNILWQGFMNRKAGSKLEITIKESNGLLKVIFEDNGESCNIFYTTETEKQSNELTGINLVLERLQLLGEKYNDKRIALESKELIQGTFNFRTVLSLPLL